MRRVLAGDKFRHKFGLVGNMSKTFEVRVLVDGLFVIRTWNKRKARYDYSTVSHREFDEKKVMRLYK